MGHWFIFLKFKVSNSGSPTTSVSKLDTDPVNLTYAVRPVISLKSSVVYKSGDGTASSPYEIVLN